MSAEAFGEGGCGRGPLREASAGEGSLSAETNPSSVAHLAMRATFSHEAEETTALEEIRGSRAG
jgi:hypothetical protein